MENTDVGRAEFCFNLVHQALAKLFGPEQSAWLDRLEAEQDNIRWALDHYSGDPRELEMVGNLGRF